MATQCRVGPRPLTPEGRRHWGQVHVHFASRCLAQACGEHECVACVCLCVFACAYIIHTLAHTQTCTAHTHDYQNVRHLSFNLIWLHLLSFVRLRLRSCLRLCLRYRHFLCFSLHFSTLSLPFPDMCVSRCCCFLFPFFVFAFTRRRRRLPQNVQFSGEGAGALFLLL